MSIMIAEIVKDLGTKNFSDLMVLQKMLIECLNAYAINGNSEAKKTLKKIENKSLVEQVARIYHDFPELREMGELFWIRNSEAGV